MRQLVRIVVLSFVLLHLIATNLSAQAQQPKRIIWTADWLGTFIIVGGNLDTLKIYHSDSLKLYRKYLISGTITRVVGHPHGPSVAIATQISTSKSVIYDFLHNDTIQLKGISPEGARGIAWNYNGDYLAVGDNDGQILIYDDEGKLIRKFQNENTKGITAVAWHPKKNVLVTVSDKIRIFDIEGNLLKSIKHRIEDVLILSIAWHQSGKFFVTGDYGDSINNSLLQYWDEQGNLIRSIDKNKGEYRNLAWNKDGTRLASASDALRIWDTKGNLIAEGKSKSYLWGVTWNRSGTKIITTSLDEQIVVWSNKAKKLRIVK